ncbi:PRC-barrel domain-containing protein [Methanobacterium spitsbergense]|uniref:PRC-barrel domain-containing protein n=1 Tax=Methanobacterium spitsbergense TaxID=2874285 RepID=A0A8T5UX43_9EURY|nr:PRC-barrel domain-containing protein [Methanobacterium spitsbergense]MBZ2166476.1 PRC-barrel domain-containing protein [Methanobacterium spitsbergense]
MKFDEIMNKEVIDQKGNSLGKVKNIEWDNDTNEIINIEIGEGGIRETLGMADRKILSYDNIESIGDKVLLKKPTIEIPEQSEQNDELDYYNL